MISKHRTSDARKRWELVMQVVRASMPATLSCMALSAHQAASAATITVTSLVDGSGCSLDEAIASANNNTGTSGCAAGESGLDRILFDTSALGTSTIPLDPLRSRVVTEDLRIDGPITLTEAISGAKAAAPRQGRTKNDQALGCADLQADQVPPLLLTASNGARMTVARTDITGTTGLAAVVCAEAGSTLELVESIVTGNSLSQGPLVGIYSTVHLMDSTVSNNSGAFSGGVIIFAGSASLQGSTLSSNISTNISTAAGFGGAVYAINSTLEAHNTVISGNSADRGGGIAARGGSIIIQDSTLAMNSATETPDDLATPLEEGAGGAIWLEAQETGSNSLTITNSALQNNTASGSGGAIALTISGLASAINTPPSISLTDSAIEANQAGAHGGGVSASTALRSGTNNASFSLSLNGSMLSENTATGDGGGLFAKGERDLLASEINVSGTQVRANTSNAGSAIATVDIDSINILSQSEIVANNSTDAATVLLTTTDDTDQSQLRLEYSSISGNTSRLAAGLVTLGANVDVRGSTISMNTSTGSASHAALLMEEGYSASLVESVIAGNSSAGASAISAVNFRSPVGSQSTQKFPVGPKNNSARATTFLSQFVQKHRSRKTNTVQPHRPASSSTVARPWLSQAQSITPRPERVLAEDRARETRRSTTAGLRPKVSQRKNGALSSNPLGVHIVDSEFLQNIATGEGPASANTVGTTVPPSVISAVNTPLSVATSAFAGNTGGTFFASGGESVVHLRDVSEHDATLAGEARFCLDEGADLTLENVTLGAADFGSPSMGFGSLVHVGLASENETTSVHLSHVTVVDNYPSGSNTRLFQAEDGLNQFSLNDSLLVFQGDGAVSLCGGDVNFTSISGGVSREPTRDGNCNLAGAAVPAGLQVSSQYANVGDFNIDRSLRPGANVGVYPLLEANPAIDAGANAATLTADARGASRPQAGMVDWGAFELRQTDFDGDGMPDVTDTDDDGDGVDDTLDVFSFDATETTVVSDGQSQLGTNFVASNTTTSLRFADSVVPVGNTTSLVLTASRAQPLSGFTLTLDLPTGLRATGVTQVTNCGQAIVSPSNPQRIQNMRIGTPECRVELPVEVTANGEHTATAMLTDRGANGSFVSTKMSAMFMTTLSTQNPPPPAQAGPRGVGGPALGPLGLFVLSSLLGWLGLGAGNRRRVKSRKSYS